MLSNDLDSPVSLLWAHQLRREHATIVAQLEELKELQPSASEREKVATRTEKAEAASSKIRKELVELKTAHQKTVKVVQALEKDLQAREEAHAAHLVADQKHEEAFRSEIKTLRELLTRREGKLAEVADRVRKIQRQVDDGNAAMEQKLLRKEDEIFELRGLIGVLDHKIDNAVIVVKDSAECPKTTGRSSLTSLRLREMAADGLAGVPVAPRDEESEVESFDLDANVQSMIPAPSGPVLGPSLAMIKEPTLPRSSQRLRDQHQPSMMGESMEMLREPSLPPVLEQVALPEQVTIPDRELAQGKSTLVAYIQIAGSQYEGIMPGEEEEFVNAFVQGLRDKRDRKKCEKKLREVGRKWNTLKECFPIASQHSQGAGKRKEDLLRKTKGVEVEQEERPRPRPALAPMKQNNPEKQNEQGPQRARPSPTITSAKKRDLVEEQGNEQAEKSCTDAPPAGKKRRTEKGARRQGRPPSIPILPSSDDEFSRGGCRK